MDKQSTHGSIVSANHPPKKTPNDKVVLHGTHNGVACSFGLTEEHLDKHFSLNKSRNIRFICKMSGEKPLIIREILMTLC